jgi:hypothetical protein
MAEMTRIEELEAELKEAQADHSRAVEKLRLAHLEIRSQSATIADLRLQLGQTKYALSRARMREISE